jgi:hypothetical protein
MPYLALMLAGAAIILLASLMQQEPPAKEGKYFLSSFLHNNITIPVRVVMACVCAAVGYFSRLNLLLSAICLIGVLFIAIAAEVLIYPESHNLLGIEVILYLWYALPGAIAGYIARWIKSKFVAVR